MSAEAFVVVALVGAILGAGTALSLLLAKRAEERTQIELLHRTVKDAVGDSVGVEHGEQQVFPTAQRPPTQRRAEQRIDKLVEQYRRRLTVEAKRVARAHSADEPSLAHVMSAVTQVQLVPPRARQIADVGLAIGAFALGIPMTYFINVWTGGITSPDAVPWLLGCGAFALFLLGVSAATKLWK